MMRNELENKRKNGGEDSDGRINRYKVEEMDKKRN